jgi:HD-like signal output (HDOD) protein
MKSNESLIDIIDNLIVSRKVCLPVFDATAARIQREIGNPEPDLRIIEKLIVSDQALTAEVLRMSNSSFYKGLTQVSTVRNAIVRLGINEVSNIVTMITHENHFHSRDPHLNHILRKLWQHSVGGALGANWLAKHCGLNAVASQAFFAGLLHDVGKLFVLTVIDELIQSGKIDQAPSAALLKEAMDSLHPGHGATLMKHWNLPDIYARIASDHHREDFERENMLLVIVRLADKACNKLGMGLKADQSAALATAEEAELLHISEVELAQLEIMLEDSQVLGCKSATSPPPP